MKKTKKEDVNMLALGVNSISANGWVYKIVLMFYIPCYI